MRSERRRAHIRHLRSASVRAAPQRRKNLETAVRAPCGLSNFHCRGLKLYLLDYESTRFYGGLQPSLRLLISVHTVREVDRPRVLLFSLARVPAPPNVESVSHHTGLRAAQIIRAGPLEWLEAIRQSHEPKACHWSNCDGHQSGFRTSFAALLSR